MELRCPLCGARYRLPADRIKPGARVRCSKCNDVFSLRGKIEDLVFDNSTAHSDRIYKVAIIEDARFFREMIRDVLAPLDLLIYEAADGSEGLELVRREMPDLVILDLNLPGLNGYELMRIIREEPSLHSVRLLAMSGVYRKESHQEAAEKAGADDFIGKSFTPETFLERVRRLLEMS